MLFFRSLLSGNHFHSDMENTKIIQKKVGIRKQEATRAEIAARIKTDGNASLTAFSFFTKMNIMRRHRKQKSEDSWKK